MNAPFFIFDGLESMDPISNSLYEVVLRGYSWAVSERVMVEWGPSEGDGEAGTPFKDQGLKL